MDQDLNVYQALSSQELMLSDKIYKKSTFIEISNALLKSNLYQLIFQQM